MAESGRRERLTSLVVPVYNEADNILPLLHSIDDSVLENHEILLVYDFDEDTTLPPARAYAAGKPQIRLVLNTRGPGVVNALATGLHQASGDVVCVVMADLSDDVTQIQDLAALVRGGAAVAVASRYMRGGKQIGGPIVKRTMSRLAGLSLRWLTRIGTHDPTSNFKAYGQDFIEGVRIESRQGFEVALELTTKAHLLGGDIREIPTIWRDRVAGESRFRLMQWLPSYLRWYARCVLLTWTGQRRRNRKL